MSMQNRVVAALAAAMAVASSAAAQEAMYTEAATMPSRGVAVIRPELNFWRYGRNPAPPPNDTERTERLEALTTLQVGLARALSFTVEAPVEFQKSIDAADGSADHDKGVSDIGLTFKYRFFKDDTGGVDTLRAALLAGAYVASGDDHDFSSQSVNPHIGAVVTMVRGRHGFNQDVDFRINTGGSDNDNVGGGEGSSDAFTHNTSYLFRISPEQYTPDTFGSWYVTVELNGIWETNGDYELKWSPGVMFEAADFAIEIMAQLPLYHDLQHRAELDFGVGIGVRVTF